MPGDALFTRIRSEAEIVTPRQRRVMTLLEERARRTELLAALSGAGGIDAEHTANVLCAELGELEISAREVSLDGLVAMARATRRVVELLGGGQLAARRQGGGVGLGENAMTR